MWRIFDSQPVALRSIPRSLPEHAAKIAHTAKPAAAGDVLDSGIRRFHKKYFRVVDTDSAQVVHDGLTGDALEYRTVYFENEVLDTDNYQGNAVVNYTDIDTPFTRIIEHKWFEFGLDESGKNIPNTVISREYSQEWKPGDEPYYPVNDNKNLELYKKYKELADLESKVIFGGRLAQYQYFDMDAVVAEAIKFFVSAHNMF